MTSSREIRLVIDSRIENIPLVGMAVNRMCSVAELSEIESYQIELCLIEAVTNAVVHAYHRQGGHDVEVDVAFESDRVTIRVSDYGDPMPALRVPRLDFDPDDRENLPEGGMGLYIIDNVMTECSYQSVDGRNTLELIKLLPGEAATGDRAGSA
jgi:serine/threonine-protein kinase RsbW